ncbi:MAG: hypothetical protein WC250_03895 [Candidatus Paceibacterota bacterium]|jgi:hypothetical protein
MRAKNLYRIAPPTMQEVLIGAGWKKIVMFALAAPFIATGLWTLAGMILSQAP